MHIFLICGYGIPKDMIADENYRTYLNLVLNKVYSIAANQPCILIPCGGPTEMEPPHERTEAAVIAGYLQTLIDRPELEQQTLDWKFVLEDQSLSSLENLLFAKRLMLSEGLRGTIMVFCEATRRDRMVQVANVIFNQPVQVEAIDFDTTKNRYRDSELIQQNEDDALKEAMWTLEKEERLVQHHELFVRKFMFFRERYAKGMSHVDVVEEWFKHMPEILRELMPDHPYFMHLAKAEPQC